jgi:murein DD-endopeptidase MepM/ murein hydrolase activator NlpD
MLGVRIRVALLVGMLAVSLSTPLLAGADPRDDLKAAEDRLDTIEGQLAANEARLATAQVRLDRAATALAETEFAYQATIERIDQVRAAVEAASARYEAIQTRLDERVRQSFVSGGGSSQLGFLLDASSFSDLSDRMQMLDGVVSDDSDLAAAVAHERAELEMQQEELEEIEARQRELLERRRDRREELQAAFGAIQETQERLGELRAEAERILADRRKDLRRWQAAQEEQAAASSGSAVVSGPGPFSACPVPGGAVSNSFGAPRSGHLHAGVDIFAAQGAEIVAPFDGTASNSTNPTGGIAIIVTSSQGHGYVYNAHLSAIEQLGPVKAGQVIGFVGTTGNAAGTSPHDHFEWHPAQIPSNVPESPYGHAVLGDAVNPYPYLASVC